MSTEKHSYTTERKSKVCKEQAALFVMIFILLELNRNDAYAVVTHLVVLTSKHFNDKIYEVTHYAERKNNDCKRILKQETAWMKLQINYPALINSVVSARLRSCFAH